MNTVSACGVCHRVFAIDENRHPFGDSTICTSCLIEQAEFGNICPSCKSVLAAEKEEIGLVLTKAETPNRKLLSEPVAMVIVCPHCRVLFFDLFQYEVLRCFKEAGARLAVK
jgi:RNA polymerase subunit RPABC4/transcription elongation factor Spt4